MCRPFLKVCLGYFNKKNKDAITVRNAIAQVFIQGYHRDPSF